MSLENAVFKVFYKKLLATRIYINGNIPKVQPWFRGQVKANQTRYYILVLMITRTKIQ